MTAKAEQAEDIPASREHLDRSLVHGIAWTSMVTWFSQILSWVSTFFVAHILMPDDYGLVATASITLGIVQMLSEFGLGAAVVRFQTLDRHQLGQFNVLSVMLGVAAMIVALGVSFAAAAIIKEPRLIPVMGVMSIAFVITAFRVVPQAVLQRQMQFRKLAFIEGTQSLTMAAANITMALVGFGYWTLALGPLLGAIVGTSIVVFNNPMPFHRPNLDSIREPFQFSKQTIATRFAWFGYSNADFLILTSLLGRHAMGVYLIGWQVAGMAVEKITALVGRVTPAFFSTLQDNLPELRRYLVLIAEGLSTLTFPVCIGLGLVAHDLVVVLGPQWEHSAIPLQLLAFLATVRSIDPLVQQALAAVGEARMNMQNSVLTMCILPPMLLLGAMGWGVNGVAVAWLICGPLLITRLWLQATRRLSMPRRQLFGALWPATSACLAMAAVVTACDMFWLTDETPWLALIAKSSIGAVTYVVALFVMHRERVMRVRQVVQTLRSRKI